MRRQRTPASPSWKPVRVRSSSLPRVRITRRNSLNTGNYSKDLSSVTSQWEINNRDPKAGFSGGVRSWATSWLTVPSPSPTRQHSMYDDRPDASPSRMVMDLEVSHRDAFTPPRRRNLVRTPVLTLALIKLDENIQNFCSFLAEPSYENVGQACSVLHSLVATASPCSSSAKSSPVAYVGSPMGSLSSPMINSPKSPIRSWLTGSNNNNESSPGSSPVSSSALVLQGEWEKFVFPLYLLAAAEAVYADLGHAQDMDVARNLIHWYQRISREIHLVREILCDPFLSIPNTEEHTATPPLAMYYERAVSLSASLHAMESLSRTRCQLIRFHTAVWNAPKQNTKYGEFGRLYNDLLPNLSHEDTKAASLCDSLERECRAWKCLMETADALERCRFTETILSAQKCKGLLNMSGKTTLHLWMVQTLRKMVTVLPIVFDRIEAYSKPLYGFNHTTFLPSSSTETKENRLGNYQDLDSQVVDFLRRQEKAGGPPMAVSVVLDAVRTSNLRIERGFTLTEPSISADTNDGMNESEKALLEWPAVYMRTTTHHGLSSPLASSSGGLLGGMRRTASRKDYNRTVRPNRSHDDEHSKSLRMLRTWSNDGSPNAFMPNRSYEEQNELNVLEYAPDSGSFATSWPHSAWNSLVAILTGTGDPTSSPVPADDVEKPNAALKERRPQPMKERRTSYLDMGDLLSIPLKRWVGSNSKSEEEPELVSSTSAPQSAPLSRSTSQTSFHLSALSDYMWLVVMVKGEEENRWHRRRSRNVIDAEVREFLNAMRRMLCVGDWFHPSYIQRLREKTSLKAAMHISGVSPTNHYEHAIILELKKERDWIDDDMQDLLQSLKGMFGLRSPSRNPIVDSLKGSYALRFRSLAGRSKSPPTRHHFPVEIPAPVSSFEASAAALFLGEDLMHAVGE